MLASSGRVKHCQRHCQCSQEATGTPDEAAAGAAGRRWEKFGRKGTLLDDHTETGQSPGLALGL